MESELEAVVSEMRRLGVKSLSRGSTGLVIALELFEQAPTPAFPESADTEPPTAAPDIPAGTSRAVNILLGGKVSSDEG